MSPQLDHISENYSRWLVYKDSPKLYIAKLSICYVDYLLCLVVELYVILLSCRISKSFWSDLFNEALFVSWERIVFHFILDYKSMLLVFCQISASLSFLNLVYDIVFTEELFVVHFPIYSWPLTSYSVQYDFVLVYHPNQYTSSSWHFISSKLEDGRNHFFFSDAQTTSDF